MRLGDDARDMLMTSQHLFVRSTTIKPPESPRKPGHIHYELKEPNLASFSCPSMWHCFLSWKQTIEHIVDFYTSTVSVFTTAAEELIWVVFSGILFQQEDVFMSLFDTLRSSLHKLRSVVIAGLILNSYEHTHPWRFYFISPSHPCSDVKQHFDPGEHVMAGWVVPACKEQYSADLFCILARSNSNSPSSFLKNNNLTLENIYLYLFKCHVCFQV